LQPSLIDLVDRALGKSGLLGDGFGDLAVEERRVEAVRDSRADTRDD
jgi:hypothetical protein